MTQPGDPAMRIIVNLALVAAGTAGASRGAYELLTQQARIARSLIPKPTSRPYDGDGLYRPGAVMALPWRPGMTCDIHMMVFGDSLAAGLGAESPGELPGVLLARGLAEESGRDVRLSIKAIVGATSKGLAGQVDAVQITRGRPDISVILVGGNDITARNGIAASARRVGEAVEALRKGGSHVVVGTCPDLGIVKPVPQPLRSVLATLSRRLGNAQAVRARRAGGVPVSLAETLAPEFYKRGESLFSPDRFHPNSAGYELAAGLLLPAVCTALGVWDESPETEGPAADADAGADAVSDAAAAAEALAPDFESDEVDATEDEADLDEADVDESDSTPDESRGSVVLRLTRRLTDFVRTHQYADEPRAESALHNEDVDGDPASTGDAREAADTLRRRSRILRRNRSPRDPDDS